MARVVLMIQCAGCGREFDTGIRIDRRNFARATFAANYHICPNCGRRGVYHKEHYRLIDEQPRPGSGTEDAPPGMTI